MNAPKRDDGGPAQDMTLRDYFAGRAMQSIVQGASGFGYPLTSGHVELLSSIAAVSYVIADAMLAERVKP